MVYTLNFSFSFSKKSTTIVHFDIVIHVICKLVYAIFKVTYKTEFLMFFLHI
jgi:hypothetical protein